MSSPYITNDANTLEEEELGYLSVETKKLVLSLPKVKGGKSRYLYLFQGFWCYPQHIHATLLAQSHFVARVSDIVVSSAPKCGTTWLKALVFSITRRDRYIPSSFNPVHPLLANNPHDLVPFLEFSVYADSTMAQAAAKLDNLSSPRLVATHVPYGSLPDSIKSSPCKIVYICRNPLDTFVSQWHFFRKARPQGLGIFTIEEAFDMWCKGQSGFGPYWEHVLGYWKESLKSPDKVMFLKYEDMKKDIGFVQMKKLAKFLGFGFSATEEKDGVVEELAKLCSFETMKDLEVNKRGHSILASVENKSFFRKGEVGDYANHLTKEMIEMLSEITEEKLAGSGLQFTI